VEYGLTIGYGSITALDTSLVTSHSIGLTGLSANATYHFRVKSKDASGNERMSSDFSFPMPDTLPPTISSVGAPDIAAHGATITWATNEPSTSQVYYGLTTACELGTALDVSLVFSHSVVLSGLSAETTYYFRVRSTDASGNEAVSGLFYFVSATCPDLGNWVDTYYYCYGELPLVPTWMVVAEGYNTGGRVHQGMTVYIPSMQWWGNLMPSQKEQVLQLIDWLGESREDYLWEMYSRAAP
jgi:phosphodiesterase/alkaline phosphatase D-like protein